MGGVILRTEHQAPREHLAERLHVSYEDLNRIVFEGQSARQATLGRITVDQHWEQVATRLGRPPSEVPALRDEFFAGDVLDLELLAFVRQIRRRGKTGLISNAWSNGRQYLVQNKLEDAFDLIILSAELGTMKPEPAIYEAALDSAQVSPQESIFVDDVRENVESAARLGMHAIQFVDTNRLRSEVGRLMG